MISSRSTNWNRCRAPCLLGRGARTRPFRCSSSSARAPSGRRSSSRGRRLHPASFRPKSPSATCSVLRPILPLNRCRSTDACRGSSNIECRRIVGAKRSAVSPALAHHCRGVRNFKFSGPSLGVEELGAPRKFGAQRPEVNHMRHRLAVRVSEASVWSR